jgi:hypothetical protein
MTCREFKHSAEALTLWELSQAQNEDKGILNHAEECESCGSWLGERRLLAASLGTLQARTARLEAGADVERAVLQAFRQTMAQNAAVASVPPVQVLAKSEKRKAKSDRLKPVLAPVALRLSRWFEIGAYVAVAAAVIVGMFLGIRLLGHSSSRAPVHARVVPAITQPAVQKPVVAAQTESTHLTAVATNRSLTAERHNAAQPALTRQPVELQPVAADDSQSDSDADYTALMFCDPLSCSADSQVVRMELPPQPGQGQPQTADVVVGYDGTVRAVRIVN